MNNDTFLSVKHSILPFLLAQTIHLFLQLNLTPGFKSFSPLLKWLKLLHMCVVTGAWFQFPLNFSTLMFSNHSNMQTTVIFLHYFCWQPLAYLLAWVSYRYPACPHTCYSWSTSLVSSWKPFSCLWTQNYSHRFCSPPSHKRYFTTSNFRFFTFPRADVTESKSFGIDKRR